MSTPTPQGCRSSSLVPEWTRNGLHAAASRSANNPGMCLALLVAAVVVVRVPFLAGPLSPDEGGYLLVASQWIDGSSLYGDYWVDRPPLLLMIFQLADLAGGPIALWGMGVVAVALAMLLSAHIGRLVAPRSPYASVACAATAAIFLTSPMFGADEVNGELLAVPFVLTGVVGLIHAAAAPTPRVRFGSWLVVGGAAVAAAAIKQSLLDVFAAAVAVALWLLWARQPARAVQAIVGFLTGAALVVGTLGWWATSRGTDLVELWDAVVTFRAHAASVISTAAPSSTYRRLGVLTLAFLGSGAVGLLCAALVPNMADGERRRNAIATRMVDSGVVPVILGAVLAWEVFAVAAGGSYWLHYLVGLVPGLVLATGVALQRRRRVRWIALTHAYSVIASLVAVFVVLSPAFATGHDASADAGVERYLAQHSRSADTAVVAFGNPALLRAAGLSSPYPDLWSLPVRVHDHQLRRFTRVIESDDRPTWVIVSGPTLTTWGIDASTAQPALDQRYRLDQVIGNWHLYRAVPRAGS